MVNTVVWLPNVGQCFVLYSFGLVGYTAIVSSGMKTGDKFDQLNARPFRHMSMLWLPVNTLGSCGNEGSL